jgi:hypothetical protein
VASNAKEFVVIADSSKISSTLGMRGEVGLFGTCGLMLRGRGGVCARARHGVDQRHSLGSCPALLCGRYQQGMCQGGRWAQTRLTNECLCDCVIV